MSLSPAICARLRATYGLDAATLGASAQRAALRARMNVVQAATPAAYEKLLAKTPAEFDALAEELLVPESWFFRDGAPFLFLESWVHEHWKSSAAGRVLRVLSVPCAGGQEPYSIAMSLLDAGLRPGQFTVCAGDVSPRSLACAREGVYGASAFRGGDATGRDHHFEPLAAGRRRVRASVRAAVHFAHANLVGAKFFREEPPFHVIFCRNVLIYFDPESRRCALANLRRCLAPGGLLFTGHADGLLFIDAGFTSAGPAEAFVYKLNETAAAPEAPHAPVAKRRTGATRPPLRDAAVAAPRARTVPVLSIDEARQLANAGDLGSAAKLCRELMKQGEPNPDAYFLLGQIAGAGGRPAEAENLFRKAVYLNPRHAEALDQLALLAERRGDRTASARLRRRAKA